MTVSRKTHTLWNFVNMNSPADLFCEWQERETVLLPEYDVTRSGHCLLSKFFLDLQAPSVSVKIESMEDGAGLGLYFGRGNWADYIMLALIGKKMQLRVPSNVPLGDTFRTKGTKPYYVLCEAETDYKLPLVLSLKKEHDHLTFWLNGEAVFSYPAAGIPVWQKYKSTRPARFFVKSLCENESRRKSNILVSELQASDSPLLNSMEGFCYLQNGQPAKEASVHLAGYPDFRTQTSDEGFFSIRNVPHGEYTLVAGCAGAAFSTQAVSWRGQDIKLFIKAQDKLHRQIPHQNLCNDYPKHNLNGLWKFGFAAADRRCIQLPDCVCAYFDRLIRVPYPWTSLAAFGEEFLADPYNLYQTSVFMCNRCETGETAWYRLDNIRIERQADSSIPFLCFGAVSGTARIWLDDKWLGDILDSWNTYSFALQGLDASAVHSITVCVWAPAYNETACMGKQGFWFTEAPGLWQGCWIEHRPVSYIRNVFCNYQISGCDNCVQVKVAALMETVSKTPPSALTFSSIERGSYTAAYYSESSCLYNLDFFYSLPTGGRVRVSTGKHAFSTELNASGFPHIWDKKNLTLFLEQGDNDICLDFIPNGYSANTQEKLPFLLRASIAPVSSVPDVRFSLGEQSVTVEADLSTEGQWTATAEFLLPSPVLWSPDNPEQYELTADFPKRANSAVMRKLGLRSFESAPANEKDTVRHFALNRKPAYLRGVLDQGYNPWGIITYPYTSADKPGSMQFDIQAAKDCGYNLIRMHIKDNEPEWYSLCDEMGIMVWDELPSNFYAKADNPLWQGMFFRQLKAMAEKHNYHVSVVLFSSINESWGITGGHELSPWNWHEGQTLIKKAARTYKSFCKTALVVDNSGYGKTMETDVIDHHCYPVGYEDARGFWSLLSKQNYPGSTFNFYNTGNHNLMKNDNVRNLLQRNSSADLLSTEYIGDEVQQGQPVIISEFVHTDGQEQMVRIFPEFGGYVRMNIASQENEDTSPLNSVRQWRDFGYIHSDFRSAGYSQINSENLLYADCPRLLRINPEATCNIPVYCSLWSEFSAENALNLRWVFHGISMEGLPFMNCSNGCQEAPVQLYKPFKCAEIPFVLDGGTAGGWLFMQLWSYNSLLAENHIRILSQKVKEPHTAVSLCRLTQTGGNGPAQIHAKGAHQLAWIYGTGKWELDCRNMLDESIEQALLIEMSSCECMDGTRITDEYKHPSVCTIFLENETLSRFELPDNPCDERGLFSDGAGVANTGEIQYERSGRWGYGYKCIVSLSKSQCHKLNTGKAPLRIESDSGGVVIYGKGTGRYGCNPIFIPQKSICRNELMIYENRSIEA